MAFGPLARNGASPSLNWNREGKAQKAPHYLAHREWPEGSEVGFGAAAMACHSSRQRPAVNAATIGSAVQPWRRLGLRAATTIRRLICPFS